MHPYADDPRQAFSLRHTIFVSFILHEFLYNRKSIQSREPEMPMIRLVLSGRSQFKSYLKKPRFERYK